MKEKNRSKIIVSMLIIFVSIISIYLIGIILNSVYAKAGDKRLLTVMKYPGGPEATGEFQKLGLENVTYDTASYYAYKTGNILARNIVSNDQNDGKVFCMDNTLDFPSGPNKIEYQSIGYLSNVDSLDSSKGKINLDEKKKKQISRLLRNIYIREYIHKNASKDTIDSEKLAKVSLFKNVVEFEKPTSETAAKSIYNMLLTEVTDDDISLIYQWLVWYIINGDNRFQVTKTSNILNISEEGKDVTDIRKVARWKVYNYLKNAVDTEYNEEEIENIPNGKDSIDLNIAIELANGFRQYNNHVLIKNLKIKCASDIEKKQLLSRVIDVKLAFEDASGIEREVAKENIINTTTSEARPIDLVKNIDKLVNEGLAFYVKGFNPKTDINLKLIVKYDTTRRMPEIFKPTNPKLQTVLIVRKSQRTIKAKIKLVTENTRDLALRKIIMDTYNPSEDAIDSKKIDKIIEKTHIYKNDETIQFPSGRTMKIDMTSLNAPVESDLRQKTALSAIYKHAKNPIALEPGSKILYGILVSNEYSEDQKLNMIRDTIPKGLMLAKDSKINQEIGWKLKENSIYANINSLIPKITQYTGNDLKSFDQKDVVLNKYIVKGKIYETGMNNNNSYSREMHYIIVPVELQIDPNFESGVELTNIAQICSQNDCTNTDGTIDPKTGKIVNQGTCSNENIDRDSIPCNFTNITENFLRNYKGVDNKEDLSDSNYYYKGREDDDDFEKVIVRRKKNDYIHDLSLRKFITKVNSKDLKESREPVVDTKPIKNNQSTATYTHSKEPVVVKRGDIVTYKLRVYNEGNVPAAPLKISDYIPKGLGFLPQHKTNIENGWKLPNSTEFTSKKAKDFEGLAPKVDLKDLNVKDISDLDIVRGDVELQTSKLDPKIPQEEFEKIKTNEDIKEEYKKNVIRGFDPSKDNILDYRDVEISLIVLDDKVEDSNFVNIAEISKYSFKHDRDSEEHNVNHKNYRYPHEEDDDDFERLVPKKTIFDLSLKKFITKIQDKNNTPVDVTDRIPEVNVVNGKITYKTKKDPLTIINRSRIEYTIRVYNEGQENGYVKAIVDRIPKGLELLANDQVTRKYEWKMFDKDMKETTDPTKAVTVGTKYLSKERSTARGENNLLLAFNKETNNVDYRDVKVAFKIKDTVTPKDGILTNTAEICAHEGEYPSPIPKKDEDSTPCNKDPKEDDEDQEHVKVVEFDLSLRKIVSRVDVKEYNKPWKQMQTNHKFEDEPENTVKTDLKLRDKLRTQVAWLFKIRVTNEGDIPGYATEITDYIPEGLEFVQKENPLWKRTGKNIVKTNQLSDKLLNPGDSAVIEIYLRWKNDKNNLGVKTNWAEISEDYNKYGVKDRDSVPGNRKPKEDDIDYAPVAISYVTGLTNTYFVAALIILSAINVGLISTKKFILG